MTEILVGIGVCLAGFGLAWGWELLERWRIRRVGNARIARVLR